MLPNTFGSFAFIGLDLWLSVHFAIGSLLRVAHTADVINLFGDGISLRSYLDHSDLAHWIFTLPENGNPSQAYNVDSDEMISIAHLANRVPVVVTPDKPTQIHSRSTQEVSRHRFVRTTTKTSID
jgi:nucleoside-diphosphate-sugar epimerase